MIKKLLHIARGIFFMLCLTTIAYYTILSQTVVSALVLIVLLNILFIICSGISFVSIVKKKQKISILHTNKQIRSTLLFIFSFFFLCYINLLAVLHVTLSEKSITKEIPTIKESIITLVNIVVPIPYKGNLLTEEFNGIKFYFPEEDTTILGIKNIYSQARDTLDEIYGESDTTRLTIIVYDSMEELQKLANIKNLTGLYVASNNSIHLPSVNLIGLDKLQEIFSHEYAHFRLKNFRKQHHISHKDIPQWFNEGISEMMENLHKPMGASLGNIVPFTDIHTNKQFHEAQTNHFYPYYQSYLAVKELVNEYGLEVISTLLLTSKEKDFYVAFQEVTNNTIDDFQATFLNRDTQVKRLLTQAEKAEKRHQYQEAENIYVEILRLDSYCVDAKRSLPHIYIRQGKFNEALTALTKGNTDDYRILSELSLLINPIEALHYAEKAEEKIKIQLNNDYFPSHYITAIQKVLSNPTEGYQQLLEENLISYTEIQTALSMQLGLSEQDGNWVAVTEESKN